jgi:hypothetical protein
MNETTRTITGKCHCGNIAFELQWPEADGDIAVRACGCDFCVKHGGVYTSHPQGVLTARVGDPAAVNRYRFGTETAEFYVCTRCGAVPFVTSEIDNNLYAVVNVNTFENVPREQLQRSASDFSGETTTNRLARRQRNWIASVSIE